VAPLHVLLSVCVDGSPSLSYFLIGLSSLIHPFLRIRANAYLVVNYNSYLEFSGVIYLSTRALGTR